MERVQMLVANLTAPQSQIGYAALKELESLSLASDQIYPYFDAFSAMLDSGNSYVRNRALVLLARNARWDREGKMNRVLDAYLAHVTDEKPITARQCIRGLGDIFSARPELAPRIRAALQEADFSPYPDSMSPLLERDRIQVLKQMDGTNI